MLMKGVIIMKMRKLVAALVVVTVLMTTVVFGASYTTTTDYTDAATTAVVTTVVTGATKGSDATYLLYDWHSINAPLHIDQQVIGATGSVEFVSPSLPISKITRSELIVGSSVDTFEDASTSDYRSGMSYKLDFSDIDFESAGIEKILVYSSIVVDEEETEGHYEDVDADNKVAYVYAGCDASITVTPKAGKGLGAIELSSSKNLDYKWEATNVKVKGENLVAGDVITFTADTAVDVGDEGTVTVQAYDDENDETVTFIVTDTTPYSTGLTIKAADLATGIATEANIWESLANLSYSKRYAIRLTHFRTEADYTWSAAPYCVIDDVEVPMVDGGNGVYTIPVDDEAE